MFDAIAQNSNYFTATHVQESAERSVAAGAEDLKVAKQEEATRKTRALPGQEETHLDGRKKDSLELSREAQKIRELQARDREVRAHEAAHASVGGSYAGAPSYSYVNGPDGQTYAAGGEVSIDVSPISGDPEATLQKAQQVRAAALAPAQPSGQDVKVAQRAQSMAAQARSELGMQRSEQRKAVAPDLSTVSTKETDSREQPAVGNNPLSSPSAITASEASGSRAQLNFYA